ncbi:hypothetical protein [Actinacidiphila oryziradicis]|uniref:hypothetical protein n=1 Tax=Actinacidiphila oryziradicis TaxID=2571141 RepID=UPI00145F131D|nr:hypothetical protein [Actinacidiphila oryziradicis]
MPYQTINTSIMLAAYTSGSHPGPPYYIEWIVICAAIVGLPVYLVRLLRARRNRR